MIPERRLASLLCVLCLSSFATLFGFPSASHVQAQESKPKRPVELLLNEADIVTRAAVCRWAIRAAGARWQARRPLLEERGRDRSVRQLLEESRRSR